MKMKFGKRLHTCVALFLCIAVWIGVFAFAASATELDDAKQAAIDAVTQAAQDGGSTDGLQDAIDDISAAEAIDGLRGVNALRKYYVGQFLKDLIETATDNVLAALEGSYEEQSDEMKGIVEGILTGLEEKETAAAIEQAEQAGIVAIHRQQFAGDIAAALKQLNELAGEEANRSDTMNGLVETAKELINGVTSADELASNLNSYLAPVLAQRLSEEKANDILALYELIGGEAKLDEQSDIMKTLIANSIKAINDATTLSEVGTSAASSLNSVKALLLTEAKNAAIGEITEAAGETPSEAMQGILADAKTAITAVEKTEDVAGVKQEQLAKIADQHLAEARAEAEAAISAVFGAEPSDTEKGKIDAALASADLASQTDLTVIAAARKTAIDNLLSDKREAACTAIDAVYPEADQSDAMKELIGAKKAAINSSETAAAVDEALLAAFKACVKQEVAELAGSEPSAEMSALITAKTVLIDAWKVSVLESIVLKRGEVIEAIEAQILLEACNAAIAEIEAAAGDAKKRSEIVKGYVANAKEDIKFENVTGVEDVNTKKETWLKEIGDRLLKEAKDAAKETIEKAFGDTPDPDEHSAILIALAAADLDNKMTIAEVTAAKKAALNSLLGGQGSPRELAKNTVKSAMGSDYSDDVQKICDTACDAIDLAESVPAIIDLRNAAVAEITGKRLEEKKLAAITAINAYVDKYFNATPVRTRSAALKQTIKDATDAINAEKKLNNIDATVETQTAIVHAKVLAELKNDVKSRIAALGGKNPYVDVMTKITELQTDVDACTTPEEVLEIEVAAPGEISETRQGLSYDAKPSILATVVGAVLFVVMFLLKPLFVKR